tara:strand:- start:1424 stop:1849 length:426 start_codon:yes stop_codon:yes gene_type:complete
MEERIAEILHRKTAFMEDRRRSLGPEYYSSKDFWDRMWQQEWDALEERLNNPQKDFDIPIDTVPLVFPTLAYKDNLLHLYTYSDFSMLHNQGIFRDTHFFIDRTGKWTKNVVKEMKTFGYVYQETINKHLLFIEPNAGRDI